MEKHVAAPWTKEKIEDGEGPINEYYSIRAQVNGEEVTICEVEHHGMEWEQFEANAHLIESAPDLLDASKALLMAIGMAMTCNERINPDDEALVKMRAAIAKAEAGK